MPIIYIALFERLIGKKAKYIIWTDLSFDNPSYRNFNSYRLMKKYAKKYGYFIRDVYSQPKFFYKGIEIKPMTIIVE